VSSSAIATGDERTERRIDVVDVDRASTGWSAAPLQAASSVTIQ